MKRSLERPLRVQLGRISTTTKGPVGFTMEAAGLWNRESLSR